MTRAGAGTGGEADGSAGSERGRRSEPRGIGPAAAVVGLCAAGGALAGLAADALFLAHVGASRLGLALAASSALLAVVLAGVGGLADRVDRRRLLAGAAVVAAVGTALLAALAGLAPAIAGVVGVVAVKQLQSAVDLGFWVVIAERLDARQARRQVPRLAAAQGLGAAAGAALVVPLARLGVAMVLVASALCYLATAALALRLEVGRRVARARAEGIAESWRGGARAVRRNPLARELAIVVAIAGAFASLAFYTLGAAAAADVAGAPAIAEFLGTIRFVVQLATLAAQLAIAPRLLDRAGIGVALVIAPVAAVAFSGGFAASGALAAAVAVQSQAKLLDAAVEAPAEKLALGLVPAELRGRVGGFLEGSAKRAGAIAGGLAALALAGWPRVLGLAMLAVAAAWLYAAARLRARLPALAVAALGARASDDAVGALADPRTVALVERDLAGAGAARAAEILVRLHARGRVDAVPALAAALTAAPPEVRGAIAAALCACAEAGTGARVGSSLAAWAGAHPSDPSAEAVTRAAGLCADDGDAGALAALSTPAGAIAALRARGGDVAAAIDDAIDDGDRAFAVREASAELARRPSIDGARRLLRALRRVRDDDALAAGIDALARFAPRGDQSAPSEPVRAPEAKPTVAPGASAQWLLVSGDLIALARRHVEHGPASVRAAALHLCGALGAELRLVVAALGDPDDDVRDAAEHAIERQGAAAAGELVAAAAYGRRAGRDRALALLRNLPVTEAALDRMIADELDLLEQTLAHRAPLAEHPLVARRLDERAREIGATTLLLLAARHRGAALDACARLWRHASDAETRARAIEIADAALPRAIATRVAAALEGRATATSSADVAIRAELVGGDRLGRALIVQALGAGGRARYRDAIASAAEGAARDLSPLALLRRITGAEDDDPDDVPTQVETLLLLGNVPLLAGLTTRQLAELAEAARWEELAAGDVAIAAGEVCDALLVVADGELREGARAIGPGQAVDDLAVVAPEPQAAPVVAAVATRVLRLGRVDFEERVDDVPGLAAAVCRVLGARARKGDTPT